MEFEKCYVFQPEISRPAKRQRTEPQGLQASWRLRQKAYRQAWQSLHERIDSKLEAINSGTISTIASFIDNTADKSTRIPAGLILTEPGAALYTSLAKYVSAADEQSTVRRVFVPLSSSSGTNLKGLLRAINQQATSKAYDDDEDGNDGSTSSRKGTKLLNYDLQILHDYILEHQIQRVVVAFEDTEAFDSALLSEVIELLHSWLDRIPIICLFSIATSVEFLQQRLSRAALKSLDGRLFDAVLTSPEVDHVFDAITAPENTLWIGSNLTSMMLERQRDFMQSIDSFIQGVQYAYMSCFYANALSIFLDPDVAFRDVPRDHFEALRNTDSFQEHTRQLVDDGDVEQASTLLTSDEALFRQVTESIIRGRDALARIIVALDLIRNIQQLLPNNPITSKPSLYNQALSGKLAGSPLFRSLFLSIRKAPSDLALQIIDVTSHFSESFDELAENSAKIHTELTQLLSVQKDSSQPLRSADDVQHGTTLRTTVVAQKVELSKQRAALSAQDTAYTALLRKFADDLAAHLTNALHDPRTLMFHEIFLFDLRSPYREVFAPRPRHALERALASPHDYLDCACCAPTSGKRGGGAGGEEQETGEEITLAASQPATAVLYQLYLESGALINGSDLWQAFRAVIGENGGEEGNDDEEEGKTMAMFQRALAELRYLGLVKATRKRVDHVAKVAWRGL